MTLIRLRASAKAYESLCRPLENALDHWRPTECPAKTAGQTARKCRLIFAERTLNLVNAVHRLNCFVMSRRVSFPGLGVGKEIRRNARKGPLCYK